ncbi:helix-turn-helix domain-containing protein [Companilactobacillus sp. FL22-1]|uniref:helix-turn-helix domain-containing protein n=1 Tax=Companilactobacillus sp. FL22-1 TaxID=3373892 RepID=UPI00375521B4
MTLYERVKTLAKERGYNLTELAEAAHIGKKSIYTWKPSKTYPNGVTPSREVLEKIGKVLNLTVEEILDTENNTVQDKATDNSIDLEKEIAKGRTVRWEGREIPPEEWEMFRRIMEGGK